MTRKLIFAMGLLAIGVAFSSRAAHAQDWTVNQSFSSCTSMLCIDAPPQGPGGLDGSGGWGWNSVTNKPVDTVYVGKPANFTVTVLQPSTVPFCGGQSLTITLTYSSRDFVLNLTDSASNLGVNPFERGGVAVFTYSGSFLCHTDQSIAYTFTPQHTINTALVTATVSVDGQQASETFPVEIDKKGKK